MLIEEINDIGAQTFQRGSGHLLNVLGPAVQAPLLAADRIDIKAEFGCDRNAFTEWSDGLAHQFLVRERTVNFRGVEESDATLERRPNQRDHLLLVGRRTVAKAHSHAAEPESRNFESAASQFPFLHISSCTR